MNKNELHKPSNICITCQDRVQQCHVFYTLVKEAQVQLDQLLLGKNTKIEQTLVIAEPKKGKQEDCFSDVENSDTDEIIESNLMEPETEISEKMMIDEKPLLTIEDENEKMRIFFNIECSECSANPKFKYLYEFKHHMTREHGIKRPAVMCCNKRLTKRNIMWMHYIFHTNPDQFKCKECDFQAKDLKGLNFHTSSHHSITKNFICNICQKGFNALQSMKTHQLTHIDETEKNILKSQYKCVTCGGGFLSKSNLKFHIRNQHEDQREIFVCDICAKRFKSKAVFLSHYKKVHINLGRKTVECKLCTELFMDEYCLKRHIQNRHDTSKVYNCDICGKISSSRNAMIEHRNFVHFREQKHKCEYCGKGFKRPLALKEHLTTHLEGVALYSCPWCDRTFNSKANFYSHRKKLHPLEYETNKKSVKNFY